ncbi:P-loop containing nucleoside triphosphate hydrolase protein [Gongronella butleri]|nr:P-loop containing nucleoside triphosphate hydrolase protein [Gongronella butleri]
MPNSSSLPARRPIPASKTATLSAPRKPMLSLNNNTKRKHASDDDNNKKKRQAVSGLPGPRKTLRERIDDLTERTGEQTGKIEDTQKLTNELESTLGTTASATKEAKDKVYELEATVKAKGNHHKLALQQLRSKHMQQNRHLETSNQQFERQLGGMDAEITETRLKTTQLLKDWEAKANAISDLQATLNKMLATRTDKEKKLTASTKKIEETDSTLMERQRKLESLKETIGALRKRRFDIDSELLHEEKLRRKMHNTLQELKGNIRVFCRMRPALSSEVGDDKSAVVATRFHGDHHDKMDLTENVIVSNVTGKRAAKQHRFQFDKAFGPDTTQTACFEEISQLVQSALDGYHVCIFAYGQTGSGKTYTMQGDKQDAGMIPRAVHQIYDVATQLNERGWHYDMHGQFLEIYNETIHDLLGNVSDYGKIKHDIRHEKNGKTTVTDMTIVHLDSPAKVKMMLRKASQQRATGATLLNERSSRSHSVFILRISGHNTKTNERTSGVLNLIDLAGSERLALSGSTGDRLTETKAINKSLSCLGDVIHALASNKEGGYIPYRNSKLTYLLQNSLGGNSKTLMFVNISPLTEHIGETLCSLRFASKVNSCRIGTARKMAS